MFFFFFLAVSFVADIVLCCNEHKPPNSTVNGQPFVKIPLGLIYGFDYITKTGTLAQVFLGIPFAQPPIGELRFVKPKDPLPFGKINNTEFGNICVPHTRRAIPPGHNADEDCLTLNVIRPKHRNTDKLPVLVWIHGGGYEIGSAKLFGYKGFADNYIPRDIIVVSFQYRLGVHGFLTTKTPEFNGNFGLFDQAKALEFINKYISYFGGDKSKVTVWGLSAGGSSAAQMVLSPYSRDYVAGAIEMSGSAYSSWAVGSEVQKHSNELIKALGCQGTDLKECMKRKTVNEIYDAVETVGYTTNKLDTVKWGPTIDGDFLPSSPFVLAKQAPKKPIIVGISDKDAGYFSLLEYSKFFQNLGIPVAEHEQFTREKLINKINTLVQESYFGNNTQKVRDLFIEKHAPANKRVGFYLDQYNLFTSNIFLFTPAVDGIISRRDAGWPVYAYEFDHFNPAIWTGRNMNYQEALGSVHTNEYTNMFDMFPMTHFNFTSEDNFVKDQLVSAISSFAKSGKPKVGLLHWPTVGEKMKYYKFNARAEIKSKFYEDEANFMAETRKYGFDMGFLMHTEEIEGRS